MIKRNLFLASALAISLSVCPIRLPAQTLTLQECRQMAHDNYPAVKQYGMIEKCRDFTLDNVAKGWLPKLEATAGAYAFTDIVKSTPVAAQMGLDMRNWLANASVTVSQNVYDGGQTSARKNVASAQAEVEKHQLDVSLYAVNERIDQLFFGILLLDEQMEQNGLLQNDLATGEQTVRSMIAGGIANQSDLDALLVERLKANQQKEALQASRKAYLRMLGVFLGKDLGADVVLEKPSLPASSASFGAPMAGSAVSGNEASVINTGAACMQGSLCQNRPEMKYYASQNVLLDAQRRQLDAQLRPTVSLFGMGTVHTKLGDMFNNGILAGGLSVSWNIGALYTRKNDIRKLEVQRAVNDNMRDVFIFQNRLQNEDARGTAEALERQIEQDGEIVRLRESIMHRASKKVQLGTESVSELVRDINAVGMARAQKSLHEVQLLQEMYRQKTLNND